MCRYCVTEASDTIRISVDSPEARASGSEAEDVPDQRPERSVIPPITSGSFFLVLK